MRQVTQWQWHLDEVFVKINGEAHYLWRAVDHEGEVLESYVTKTRDKSAAFRVLKKAMKRYGAPRTVATDRLRSYGAAMKDIGNIGRQEVGRHLNNRAENSHLPFRHRERRMSNLQKFASTHASFHTRFNLDRHINRRQSEIVCRLAETRVCISLTTPTAGLCGIAIVLDHAISLSGMSLEASRSSRFADVRAIKTALTLSWSQAKVIT
ncbi:DDE-type integrase/transposase/recombinase [Henriciella sp. AS95]